MMICTGATRAQCTLPYQITNGQTADATQVMANFNALLACVNGGVPGGSANAIQYNSGAGTFAGVGPLTDGQLVVGSTAGAPQAQTLSAGSGISITNSPGNITIASTGGGGGTGLYGQVLSATPTSSGTGLTNWLNQGSATVSDSAVGLSIQAPLTSPYAGLVGRYVAAPTPPYKVTALIVGTRNSSTFGAVGIGWYNGTDKLHLISLVTNNSASNDIFITKWNTFISFNSNDLISNHNAFSQPIWFQLADDGTNVKFSFSQDGANFMQLFSVAKSSAWLGASGYNNLVFFADPEGGASYGTLMSWNQQ